MPCEYNDNEMHYIPVLQFVMLAAVWYLIVYTGASYIWDVLNIIVITLYIHKDQLTRFQPSLLGSFGWLIPAIAHYMLWLILLPKVPINDITAVNKLTWISSYKYIHSQNNISILQYTFAICQRVCVHEKQELIMYYGMTKASHKRCMEFCLSHP